MPKFLIVAYIVTWAVHVVYWAYLWRRWDKLKKDQGR